MLSYTELCDIGILYLPEFDAKEVVVAFVLVDDLVDTVGFPLVGPDCVVILVESIATSAT